MGRKRGEEEAGSGVLAASTSLVRSSPQCCPHPSSRVRPWNTGLGWALALTAPGPPGLPLAASSRVQEARVKASAARRQVSATCGEVLGSSALYLHPALELTLSR